jgi:hypothetical protein
MSHCTRCSQPRVARGLCKHHYAQHRYAMISRGQWTGRVDSTGTARRLQALVALGYPQTYLWDRLTGDAKRQNCHHLLMQARPTVNARTARKVAELYDELSMTPGPSDRSRRKAVYRGWAPPLAWDEDEIDNPEAHPDTGIHAKPKFVERYTELRELGYSDFDILRKWEMQPNSLLRQLHRYSVQPTPELVTFATEIKRRKVAS